ncbi:MULTISPECIES: lipopolysaccharide biosynthesis protein [Micromonospora]|uniref:Polysaccharide biosynthesis protein n=1 Tax=Micromonospora sicca TaxID=2202420 RepID=A0A317DFL7_9ACTN|nr:MULTISPECIES: oligosaccharide flippase family protein [unclassified Micromonospora]MBM0225779.1 oligosaccharide flippase family protein [Micromonospora sp. ATA51]PWR13254.1 hypothetical protein DKT69_21500 [Micromonospora sp. 4G51]
MSRLRAVRGRMTASRRGVLSIAAGSAGGQVLALAAAPLLARLYSPADFGVFTIVAALVTTIGTVAAFRFELAVPLPERERDAQALVALGLAAAAATALLGTVAVLLVGDGVAGLFGRPELRPWLWLVPPAAAATAAVLVLNQMAIRHRRYGSIGRRNFLQSATMVTTQVVAGAGGLRSGGLSLGLGMGQVVGALVLLPGARSADPEVRAGRRLRHLWESAVRYRRFPLLLAPSGLLNILGLQLPILFIAYWYPASVAGYLGLTQRVIAMPAALVASAVAQVYLAEISRAVRGDGEGARRIFVGASRKLTLVAGPAALAVVLGAPAVFAVVFGAPWRTSGAYTQALALYMAAQIIASPLSQTLIVLERQGLQLAWDVGRVVLVTGAVVAAARSGASALTAIWALGVSGAVAYGAAWLMSLRAVTVDSRRARQAAAGPRLVPVRAAALSD